MFKDSVRFETGAACNDWYRFIRSSVSHFRQTCGEPRVLHCNPSVAGAVLLALASLGLARQIDVVTDFNAPFHAIVLGRGQ